MTEITEIMVHFLLKTNRRQCKMAAAFTSDFVAKVNIGKCPDDRGCLYFPVFGEADSITMVAYFCHEVAR